MSNKAKTATMKNDDKTALTPKLRFPEFREEWRESQLGSIINGFQEKSTVQDEYEVLTSARLGLMKQVDYYGEGRITERDNVGFNVIPADYLTYRSRTDDGKFYFNHNNLGMTGIVSVYYPVFYSLNGSNAFLASLLNRFSAVIGTHSVGTSQRVLPLTKLLRISLPIPGSKEQQKIAECLSSVDELIAAQSRKVNALKTHKKGLMQQLLPREGETQPRLRFPEFRKDWDETRLENLCVSISSGKDHSDPDGAYDLYGSTGVIGKTDTATFASPRLLVARVGANAGLLTMADGQFGVTDNTLIVSPNPSTNLSYIYYYLGNIKLNKLIFGSGQPLITGGILKNLPVFLPAKSEQENISECLLAIDAAISAEIRKLETLNAHKKGLMQQLFPSPEAVEA